MYKAFSSYFNGNILKFINTWYLCIRCPNFNSFFNRSDPLRIFYNQSDVIDYTVQECRIQNSIEKSRCKRMWDYSYKKSLFHIYSHLLIIFF